MSDLITKKQSEVQNVLCNALTKLIVNRLEDSTFTDEEEIKNKRYYFSTLEGLECLLIPFVNLPKLHFWEPFKKKYPELKNIIIDDINFILNFNRNQEQPPIEHGEPYFIQGGYARDRQPFWTSECSSFTISVLTNFLILRKKYGFSSKHNERDILNIIKNNYEWVRMCKRDKLGWSWIHGTAEHPWPTWSLLDTFEEITWFKTTHKIFPNLEEEMLEVVGNIMKSFKQNEPFPYLTEWNDKVSIPNYNVESALNLIRLMLAATIYGQDKDIFYLAKLLYQWASNANLSNFKYRFYLNEKANNILDSSLIPSLFRTLILMRGKLYPKRIDTFDDEIEQDHENVLHRIYDIVMRSQIKSGKYKDLWGISNESETTYELYFTERTIESLTEFLLHFKGTKALSGSGIKKIKSEKMKQAVSKKKQKSQPPNDLNKYTIWIPELAEQKIPRELKPYVDWRTEDLMEFYLYRLFTNTFGLDATEWGYRFRGKEVPDGRFIMPDNNNQCLYDAKSSKGSYNITISEIDKFLRYAKEGKKKALAIGNEVQYFVIIANSFAGDLKKRSDQFYSKATMKLVCIQAEDLCKFADKIDRENINLSKLRLIKWSRLLSEGTPVVESSVYDKIIKNWLDDIKSVL